MVNQKKASRIIGDEDINNGDQVEDEKIFEAIKGMFPKRRKENLLPNAAPHATSMGHNDQVTVRKAIERLQGAGGVSHFDAKQLRRVINAQVFVGEARRLIQTLSEICNNLAVVQADEEATMPLRAV